MDYCEKLGFEEPADFDYLKFLVLQAAENAQVNIFDNIFDWTELLTAKRVSSDNQAMVKSNMMGSEKVKINSDRQKSAMAMKGDMERCKKF